jgi:hypothetical protein
MSNLNGIKILFDDNSEESLSDAEFLKAYLEETEVDGATIKLRQQQKKILPGQAGGELEAILSITLAAPAVIEFVKLIGIWLKSREDTKVARIPKIKIVVKNERGEMSIDASNLSENEKATIEKLSDAIKP